MKMPELQKQEAKKQDDITLKQILNTVDYTIEGINKLYGHERYSYRETYKPDKFKAIDYHRKESCGPNKGTTIRDSMRNNDILCETQDYIDKHLLPSILSKLGMEKLEPLFRLHKVTTVKDMINVDNKKLSSLGLNSVNINRFKKLVEKFVEDNKSRVFQARKRACNCEYERFLKNMVFRDRYDDVKEDHIKPFKEARDMCEKCFRFEQELLMKGYVDYDMNIEDSMKYLETKVYDRVEDIIDNKLSAKKYDQVDEQDKLDTAIDEVWFEKSHPKGFKKTIAYEDFKDRVYLRDVKERQLEIREKLQKSMKRLEEKKKTKLSIMKELDKINEQRRRLLGAIDTLKDIVDKYRNNKELYLELRKNGKITGINSNIDLKEIENYVDVVFPKMIQRYSVISELRKDIKNRPSR